MRWYGPGNDVVSLNDIQQAGATGVVTALHDIPTGQVWPKESIEKRKQEIEWYENRKKRPLTLSVIESVNVHESIKIGLPERDQSIENYQQTIRNLAGCGIYKICYNFMPVLDWTRTDLGYLLPDGSRALRFDAIALAAFDLFILERKGAKEGLDPEIIEKATKYFRQLPDDQKIKLQNTIMAGLPGTDEVISISDFRSYLDLYEAVDRQQLKKNLAYFLQAIIPVAEEVGVQMAIHPDDPPFPILGLPRIVSTLSDLEEIINILDSPSNGITLCTGSLGARKDNDLIEIVQRIGHRINFLHLRSVQWQENGSFYEANHLEGNADLYAVMKAVITEQERRKSQGRSDVVIPMRPDHGHDMLDDLNKKTHPGYGAIGRLRGLAELRGMELALRRR